MAKYWNEVVITDWFALEENLSAKYENEENLIAQVGRIL